MFSCMMKMCRISTRKIYHVCTSNEGKIFTCFTASHQCCIVLLSWLYYWTAIVCDCDCDIIAKFITRVNIDLETLWYLSIEGENLISWENLIFRFQSASAGLPETIIYWSFAKWFLCNLHAMSLLMLFTHSCYALDCYSTLPNIKCNDACNDTVCTFFTFFTDACSHFIMFYRLQTANKKTHHLDRNWSKASRKININMFHMCTVAAYINQLHWLLLWDGWLTIWVGNCDW